MGEPDGKALNAASTSGRASQTAIRCNHPKGKRSLLDGYEVVCECGEAVGRVARHSCDVVFGAAEAKRLLGFLGDAGRGTNERAKLERAGTA